MESEHGSTDAREDIMWGVYQVLADTGFADLTTQRVADAAGCSQSLVHYHYDTKEDLVVAFLEWVRAGEGDWLAAIDADTAEGRLRQYVDAQLSVPRDDEHGRFNVAFLELHAAAARNERFAAALRGFSSLVQDTLTAIIRDGVETGEFRAVDPESTARFLRHALHSAVAEALVLGVDVAKPQARTAAEAYIERVILAEAA